MLKKLSLLSTILLISNILAMHSKEEEAYFQKQMDSIISKYSEKFEKNLENKKNQYSPIYKDLESLVSLSMKDKSESSKKSLRRVIEMTNDLDSLGDDIGNVLIWSVILDCKILAKFLIDSSSVNIDYQNENGITALMYASEKSDSYFLKLLLDSGAKIDLTSKSSLDTALTAAAKSGYLENIKLLLNKGANINEHNIFGTTALGAALKNRYKEIVIFLLKNGANKVSINIKDEERKFLKECMAEVEAANKLQKNK